MYRGTTPIFTFKLPFSGEEITVLSVCFAQQNQIILEKALCDCVVEENTVSVKLSEEETLLFNHEKGLVEMQLRVGCGEARMASNIMIISVKRILKDGCLE